MTSERKFSHLEICRDRNVGSREETTHLEDVHFVHNAAPEIALDDVDLECRLFGKLLSAPILISAMTGGHVQTKRVNENLAIAASELQLGMCVGSQRAALENPALEGTFKVVRDVSRDILVIANIGAAQLLAPHGEKAGIRAVDMVEADALAIHLNPLQELVQPGGDSNYRGVLGAIKSMTKAISVPVVVKETGCGISRDVAGRLLGTGVAAIDVAGVGGTSWAAVEHYSASSQGDEMKAGVAETFWDWGIPTAMSICEVASLDGKFALIASGGIKNGLEVAKSLALGADASGIARPLLIPAFAGGKDVTARLERVIRELKVAAMLVGAEDIPAFRKAKVVVTGRLMEWLESRKMLPGRR
jgi:isopentenyl-diphosphate delta-isomerase